MPILGALDAFSLLSVLAVSHVFFGALLLVIGRKESGRLRLWGAGSFLAGSGVLLILLRAHIPAFFSIAVANLFVLFGLALMLYAVGLHLKYRYVRVIPIVWFSATVVPFALLLATPLGDLVWLRVAFISFMVAMHQGLCAYLLISRRARQTVVGYVLIGTFLLVALFFFARAAEAVIYLAEYQFFNSGGTALLMLGLVMVGYLQSPAFLFLVYEDSLLKSQQTELALVTQAAEQIAECARVEERIRQKRNETIEHIAYGFAHDMSNALGLLEGAHRQLTDQLDTSDLAVFHSLRQCGHAMQLAQNTVAGVSALSGSGPVETQPVRVNQIMDEFLSLVRRQLRDGIELRANVDAGLTAITHPGLFLSALNNLTNNAQNAMTEGGQLSVTAEWRSEMPSTSPAVGMVIFGPVIIIRITDTGCGMDWATQRRIFEPLFTTRPQASGSGLGLFMVRAFIERAGGAVLLRSAIGEGTTISVVLPAKSGPLDKDGALSIE